MPSAAIARRGARRGSGAGFAWGRVRGAEGEAERLVAVRSRSDGGQRVARGAALDSQWATMRTVCSAGVIVDSGSPTVVVQPSTPARDRWLPLILTLDMHGAPYRWITWQHACHYYARDCVAWAVGESAFTVYGGLSRGSGMRSQITAASIIAIKGKALAGRVFQRVPPLNNRELFHRDRHMCAYCEGEFGSARLTRDHIVPFSRGGRDGWMNVVTACRPCNERKSDRSPEQSGMELLYAPYVPNRAEYLILTNRRILADQMEFLAQHLPPQSRVHPHT